MGKPRVIAETGAGQHGVATATACALLGHECVVYMGTEDMRRQTPNVERMRLLGAEVAPVEVGRADAQGGRQRRDPRLGRERRHHPLRDRLGRRARALSGARARPPARDRRRGPRAGARGGGRPAGARDRLRRRRLERDRDLLRLPRRRRRRADRRRGGGGGARQRPHRRLARRRARPASCTARSPRCSPTTRARSSRRTRSRPGSTTPASAPSTRSFATPAAPATRRSPTTRRSRPSSSSPGSRGSSRRSSPRTRSRGCLADTPGEGEGYDLVCLSGRGDKDLAEVLDKLDGGTMGERIAAAFGRAKEEGRAALMPYMMGGFPDRAAADAIADAYADSGADLIELGVPVLGPARRRAGDPRRRDQGARRRRDARGRARDLRPRRRSRPGGADGLRQHRPRGRSRALREAARRGRRRRARSSPTCRPRRAARYAPR